MSCRFFTGRISLGERLLSHILSFEFWSFETGDDVDIMLGVSCEGELWGIDGSGEIWEMEEVVLWG